MQRAMMSLTVLAALVLAGCVNQAQPVDQNLSPTNDPPPSGDGGGAGANNTTVDYKPPVARMQIFDVDGALVYEANFVAENTTAPAPVQGGAEVRFLASNSEAVDKTASLERWEWAFGDGRRASGRGVSHTFADTGGVFRVTLTVTDSHGLADQQVVTLGVRATRTFTEPFTFTGALQVGTTGVAMRDGLDVAAHPLELLANVQGFPVEVEGLVLNLTPGEPTSDFDLFLDDAEGERKGRSASGPAPGGMEEIVIGPGELAGGPHTVVVRLFLGVNGTYTIQGEVLYRVLNPLVEEMFGGHAH